VNGTTKKLLLSMQLLKTEIHASRAGQVIECHATVTSPALPTTLTPVCAKPGGGSTVTFTGAPCGPNDSRIKWSGVCTSSWKICTAVGQSVQAKFAGDMAYWPATIASINGNQVTVNWADNDDRHRTMDYRWVQGCGSCPIDAADAAPCWTRAGGTGAEYLGDCGAPPSQNYGSSVPTTCGKH
jgi:hypothetical protein